MPADLNNPFGPSCCDGGECSTSKESARPCGCDFGTTPPHLCERHQLASIKAKLRWLIDNIEITYNQYLIAQPYFADLNKWANDD